LDTINREIYHRKRENIAGNHHPLQPPLNNKEKLTNKVKKAYVQSMSYIYFSTLGMALWESFSR